MAILGGIVAALLVLLPGQAQATHVQCGDVVTQSTTLDSDLLDCPGDGVVIGAPGITLDLGGHTIDGTGAGSGGQGVDDSAGHDGVTVSGGTIQEFQAAVYLEDADGSRVRRLTLTDSGSGVWLTNSDAGVIERNTLLDAGIAVFGSDDNVIRANRVSGPGTAIILWGGPGPSYDPTERTVIERNSLVGNGVGIASIFTAQTVIRANEVTGSTGDGGILEAGTLTVIEDNTVSESTQLGISIAGNNNRAGRNRVTGNGTDGITVAGGTGSAGTVLERNVASGNGDDGIDVNSSSATITRNTADDNADLGIEAEPGVTDGGGNRARGNGNPVQCLNVSCR
jgi:parallel beta-helix repeat protein